MEIFMSSISWSATKVLVDLEIAKVLHSPDYASSSSIPLNFRVNIHPDRRAQHAHSGRGTLTLPAEELGRRFLSEYGGLRPAKKIAVLNRRIVFNESGHKARQAVVQEIQLQPYLDPVAVEERERRLDEIRRERVAVCVVQSGWECWDKVFSAEWTRYCPGTAALVFGDEKRELRVKFFRALETQIIAIRFSQIYWSSVSHDSTGRPVLFLSLQTAPMFESELPPDQMAALLASAGPKFMGNIYDLAPRKRLSFLDQEHARITPYASLAFRIVFETRSDLATFRRLSRAAQFPETHDYQCYLEHRELLSEFVMQTYARWLEGLDWLVAFQVEAIVRAWALNIQEVLELRAEIHRVFRTKGPENTASLLRHFCAQVQVLYAASLDSQGLRETVRDCFLRSEREVEKKKKSILEEETDGIFSCLHVTVTPTTLFLSGPFPERSNRVMRAYSQHHDCFLRVSFVEESHLQYRWDREVDGPAFVRERVGGVLRHGLTVAGRKFEFLAYSQSALKEHAVWFVTPFLDEERGWTNAASIISNLGSFDNLSFDSQLMYCPARYAARISQSFTATDASIPVEAEEIMILRDIERNGSCFTDGCGTISPSVAKAIWKELNAGRRRRSQRHLPYPRAYQVRFMGSKGMLSVDYRLQGEAICLRDSMIKFEAPESRWIEIARAFDKPTKFYLNRPLIMLLEGLGVPYEVFKDLQDAAVEEAQRSVDSLDRAARLLDIHGLGASFRVTSVIVNLSKLQMDNLDGVFYQQMMEFAINHVLREMKTRARIPVSNRQSWTLVGIADVHNYLEEGEIFACVKDRDTHETIYLEGPAMITRSPTIHPGDVQNVRAIGRPPAGTPYAKDPLVNTVVLPIKGHRSLASCLGGGDLDGDVYNVSTMSSLIPPSVSPAASYDPAPKKLLDRPSTMNDVADFVVDYINSDVLGIIAVNWLIIADQSPQGIFDPDCQLLAKLHSDAVDFQKSGQPVPLKQIPKLHFRAKPDWNAPETSDLRSADYYTSQRAIGRLYRSIELPALRTAREASRAQKRLLNEGSTLEDILENLSIDDADEDNPVAMVVEDRVAMFLRYLDLDESLLEDFARIFYAYTSDLRNICMTHALSPAKAAMLSEEEAVVGTIVANTSQPRKRKDLISKLRERTAELVSGVRAEIAGDEDTTHLDHLRRAWTAWKIALAAGDSFGANSFGWITLGAVFDAIRSIEEEDRYYP